MKKILILPEAIITSNYYILHSVKHFREYIKLYKSKKRRLIPPVPVIPAPLVTRKFNAILKEKFNKFKKKHQKAKYFLLDGSHRTTAAYITNNKISAIVIEKRSDVSKAIKMWKSGKLKQWRLGDAMEKIVGDLVTHFNKKPRFHTVNEKANKLRNI